MEEAERGRELRTGVPGVGRDILLEYTEPPLLAVSRLGVDVDDVELCWLVALSESDCELAFEIVLRSGFVGVDSFLVPFRDGASFAAFEPSLVIPLDRGRCCCFLVLPGVVVGFLPLVGLQIPTLLPVNVLVQAGGVVPVGLVLDSVVLKTIRSTLGDTRLKNLSVRLRTFTRPTGSPSVAYAFVNVLGPDLLGPLSPSKGGRWAASSARGRVNTSWADTAERELTGGGDKGVEILLPDDSTSCLASSLKLFARLYDGNNYDEL
uniref:Uncharacterized protein n=1 Tax=Anopheles atroparvus TaxID=41427 RepID=A0A182IN17_ANOAO